MYRDAQRTIFPILSETALATARAVIRVGTGDLDTEAQYPTIKGGQDIAGFVQQGRDAPTIGFAIATEGISYVELDGMVAAGEKLQANLNGKLGPVQEGSLAVAQALEPGTKGDTILAYVRTGLGYQGGGFIRTWGDDTHVAWGDDTEIES